MAEDWWKGAVIYQIYPRSFCDSNNDGIGDLPGIASRVDYLRDLGVDGVWLSPFFRSPMKDFGYDISDYKDTDPIFGTMEDFDGVLNAAHNVGLKLIIDQVYSHTSDQHMWFKESRTSKDNQRADWYVWADAKPDGTAPNNWLSIFGGPAWSWDTRRRQYYMHNFLTEQPDLNFHNVEVRNAIFDVTRFWLERGVDGFRLDVANFYYCDRHLKDNPPKSSKGGFQRPYAHQQHKHDKSQPENLTFMEDLRSIMDEYPNRMTVAEIGSDSYIERSMEYTAPGRLHTAYNFLFLENGPLTASLIREGIENWTSDDSWPSWSFSNHDVVRVRTRWGGENASDEFAQMLLGLLMTLRGTIFLYQGEELGLPQAYVPYDRLVDPEGITFWPDSLGRDGCRTPMPWYTGTANAGFSVTEPWLPVDPRHTDLAVDRQVNDPDSTLHKTKKFIATRREYVSLRLGDMSFIDTPEPILCFTRSYGNEKLLCAFNLGYSNVTFETPGKGQKIDYGLPGELDGDQIVLPPYGGLLMDLTD